MIESDEFIKSIPFCEYSNRWLRVVGVLGLERYDIKKSDLPFLDAPGETILSHEVHEGDRVKGFGAFNANGLPNLLGK